MSQKTVKRRSRSFFGLHFDFHASPEKCPEPIGKNTREEDIVEICTKLHPDYIQVDCKGHPGWASYPTACGNAMPNIVGDPLKIWREATAKCGVALYVHYSGVWDQKFCTEHPEEAILQADGTRHALTTCRLGSYDDTLMIPQLIELATKYKVDGAWVDGECWGSYMDYDPRVVKAFEEETGIALGQNPPKKREDPYYAEYLEFNRELFRRHIRKCADAVHAVCPTFQFCSNWAFSDHMPEEVSAPVDFLSGDFDPGDSVTSARYAGRALARQNRPWDLMSWGFRNEFGGQHGFLYKEPVQLIQEAASVISLGGGYQIYLQQNLDGSPKMNEIRSLMPVSKFVRDRKPYCRDGKVRADVALLLSSKDRLSEAYPLYGRNGCERIKGLTNLLLDSGYTVRYIFEEDLQSLPKGIRCIVIPELFSGLTEEAWTCLFRLPASVSLLLVGPNTCRIFGERAGTFQARISDGPVEYVSQEGDVFGMTTRYATLSGRKLLLGRNQLLTKNGESLSAYMIRGVRLRIGLLGFDIGTDYLLRATSRHKTLIRGMLSRMFEPGIELVRAKGTLELAELEARFTRYVFLTNQNGQHRSVNIATEDYIPPVSDVSLRIRMDKPPRAVTLLPDVREIPCEWHGGVLSVELDRVEDQSILAVLK